MREAYVIGVGMAPFGRFPDKSIVDHGVTAATGALTDAGVTFPDVGFVACGASSAGSIAGNRVVRELGPTGVEVISVDNASASGSSAFRQAVVAVQEGRTDIAMALGVGKLDRDRYRDPRVLAADSELLRNLVGTGRSSAAAMFALFARRRMHDRGTDPSVFARITVKDHLHASMNPNACFRNLLTVEEAMGAKVISDPIRLYDCTPTCDGGAAAIVASEDVARRLARHPLVAVRGSVAISDLDLRPIYDHVHLTEVASQRLYESTGIGPADLDLVQVHDAFSSEELDYYEPLGVCPPGDAEKLVMEGATQLGGRIPFSTDGGLVSRGHPLGPTGLAQIWETTLQLRHQAGARQVENARTGLVHMMGNGDVCIVHMLQRA